VSKIVAGSLTQCSTLRPRAFHVCAYIDAPLLPFSTQNFPHTSAAVGEAEKPKLGQENRRTTANTNKIKRKYKTERGQKWMENRMGGGAKRGKRGEGV